MTRQKLVSILLAISLSLIASGFSVVYAAKTPHDPNPKYGSVLLAGTDWLSGGGVNVYVNGDYLDTLFNGTYQCVELINRLYMTKGWISSRWSGNGYEMFDTAPSSFSKEADGQITSVNPGDVIVQTGGKYGGYGHVSIVDSVSGSGDSLTVNTVNQNISQTTARSTFIWHVHDKKIDAWNTFNLKGIVHAPTTNTNAVASAANATPFTPNLLKNASFDQGTQYWVRGDGTNWSVIRLSVYTRPFNGNFFLVTNTSQGGGSVYEDVDVKLHQGDTLCADVPLVTYGDSPGSSGKLVLWLDGNYSEKNYSNLPGNNAWQMMVVCNTAQGEVSHARFQIYPGVNSPTVAMGAVNLHQTLNQNADFGWGGNHWYPGGGANFAVYGNGERGVTAYEGAHYAATDGGGSLYEDIATVVLKQGQTLCAHVMLSALNGTASGQFDLWLGTHYQSVRYAVTSSLWQPYTVCNTAPEDATGARVQFYPDAGSATLLINAVDVHYDAASNGDFSWGGNSWKFSDGGNFAVYSNSERGTSAYEGSHYGATDGGHGIFTDIKQAIAQGQTVCAVMHLTTVGSGSATGTADVWLNGHYAEVRYATQPGIWQLYNVCLTSDAAIDQFRIQFYTDAGSPTLGIGGVDVQ